VRSNIFTGYKEYLVVILPDEVEERASKKEITAEELEEQRRQKELKLAALHSTGSEPIIPLPWFKTGNSQTYLLRVVEIERFLNFASLQLPTSLSIFCSAEAMTPESMVDLALVQQQKQQQNKTYSSPPPQDVLSLAWVHGFGSLCAPRMRRGVLAMGI
jgi:hypothetical protein